MQNQVHDGLVEVAHPHPLLGQLLLGAIVCEFFAVLLGIFLLETRYSPLNPFSLHPLVHSYPTRHIFGPNADASDRFITYRDIASNSTLPLFFNLYSCYACNYTTLNNIGTQYLFNGGNTLTVIGSSRSEGMSLYQPFYDALKEGKTIGKSFNQWFYNPEIETLDKELMYYGMTILGDPLATIQIT
ncbi:MAG: hypothetical protein ACOC44_03260 [Promethearchaeia archaeon]